MEPRVTLITLSVLDVDRALAFYEALGFAGAQRPDDEIAFVPINGLVLALWQRTPYAEDAGVGPDDLPAPGAATVAHNVGSPDEVDAVLAEAQAAGGTVRRAGRAMDWGGYSGTFLDPDGHPWEVAHNPFWPLQPDGTIRLA